MNNHRQFLLFATLAGSFGFIYFGFLMPFGMMFKEELTMFTYDSDYILAYFSRPGCLSSLAGDFLTQFFYNRWLGAAVMALFMAAAYTLSAAVLRRFFPWRNACALALLPACLELLAAGKLTWSLAMPAGWMIAAASFCGYATIRNRSGLLAAQVLGAAALYVLAGSAAVVFALLVVAFEADKGGRRLLCAAAGLLLPIVVCHALSGRYLLTLPQAFAYPFTSWGEALGAIALVGLAAVSHLPAARAEWSRAVRAAVSGLVAMGFGLIAFKFAPYKVEDVLRIRALAAEEQWDAVLQAGRKLQDPVAASYVNIALSSQGTMGERLMEFYQPASSGLFLEVSPSAGWWTIYFASDAYFHVGDMIMAQHAAMLGMIFSPRERSSRLVERLAGISIITGDTAAAMKFIAMLDRTLFHRGEARRLRAQALAPDDSPEISAARKRIHSDDIIRSHWPPVESLESLAGNPYSPQARNYLLAYHLLHKDIPAFFNAYTLYYIQTGAKPPRAFAEALLIYLAATGATADKVRALNIAPETMRAFADYTRTHEQSAGNLHLLQQRFPASYWVYYHFATFR
ncbi:MAG: DUF6057 family protein [Tannerellaceae bacterium]|nr:DUF6057 family protein [Tannerellaceae bacterium]